VVKIVPTIDTDVDVFQGEMIGWWKAINPEWRRTTEDFLPITRYDETANWGGMLKAGPNGMFLVVMCMAWWGKRDDIASKPIWATVCSESQGSTPHVFGPTLTLAIQNPYPSNSQGFSKNSTLGSSEGTKPW
jgi:hypothetical protein